jgi:hypothetical protein
MSIITKYIDYLKNNPEHYWFKRKLYGWGWAPATREGWLAVLVYLLFVLFLAFRLETIVDPDEVLRTFVAPLIAATLLLLSLSYYKGEPPRWQWGVKESEDHQDP